MTSPKLEVPGGIDDPTNRLLVDLINERFDALPIERVLVWFLEGQSQESLRMSAELLGLTGPEFGGAAPTAALLKQGAGLRRIRGTPGALEDVVEGLGYDDEELDEEAFKFCDGSILANGEWRAGADRNQAFFQVYFRVEAPMSADAQRVLWDIVQRWSRPGTAFAIGVRQEGEQTLMIRERPAA